MKEFEVKVKKEIEIEKEVDGKKVKEKETVETPVAIAPIKVQKGKGRGSEYLAPKNVSTLTLKDLLAMFSEADLVNKLFRPKFKQFCATISAEAGYEAGKRTASDVKAAKKEGKIIQECGIQDEEKFYDAFSRMFSSLSARGETVAGLSRQQNELLAEFGDLDENAPDFAVRSAAIFREIKKIREALAEKNTESEGDDSEEEGKPEAVAA